LIEINASSLLYNEKGRICVEALIENINTFESQIALRCL